MTEVSNPRAALLGEHYARHYRRIGCWYDHYGSTQFFRLHSGVLGIRLRLQAPISDKNRRNMALFTFLAVNTGYGAFNWM